MPYVPVENTVEVELRGILLGSHVENTFYFYNSAGPSTPDMIELAHVVEDWVSTYLRPLAHPGMTWTEVVITDLTTQFSSQIVNAEGFPISGNNTGGSGLPNETAFVVKATTANRGRAYRGRNYFSALSTNQLDDANTINEGIAGDFVDAMFALLGAAAALTPPWEQVVVSRFHGKLSNGKPAPRTTGLHTPILSFSYADLILDSRRSRKPGVGI